MDKIKTTHVGSLPRSNELSELLFKKDKKEKIDLVKFDNNFVSLTINPSALGAPVQFVVFLPINSFMLGKK